MICELIYVAEGLKAPHLMYPEAERLAITLTVFVSLDTDRGEVIVG
jgi:hypothetical protein